MFQVVNQALAIGADTDNAPEKMVDIAEKGYKAVLDLCAPSEPKKLDGEVVSANGLSYINFPITPANLGEETLKTFEKTVVDAPKPLYIRCGSGLRAGVFTTLALMEEEDLDYGQQLQTLGIKAKPDCPIDGFAKDYLQAAGKLN